MGAGRLAGTLKISKEEAKEYIQEFNSTFKTLVKWLKSQQEAAWDKGYAKTFLGRKRYFAPPIRPEWNDEWDDIDFDPNNHYDENMPKELKIYYSKIASIKREGGNSPIQGGNADITKIAMYRIRKFIREYERDHNNGNYLAHIALQVYDEILLDCPEEMAPMFAKMMDRIMKEAGMEVIINVPVETGCLIADTWIKG